MELYIHIPFCRSKCRYCDFASYPHQESVIPVYTDALLTEARLQAEALGHPSVETVFIGGGTPSLLPPEILARILREMRSLFSIVPDAEITSEANPGTITPVWLTAAVEGGINRLSLGMQASQPALLKALGRIHTAEDAAASVHLARAHGIRNISLDLMFGLPGQTMAQWRETLQAALMLRPQHLSCYGLIPEEGTPLFDDLNSGRLTLPDEALERAMYDETLDLLSLHGFKQYEISNFALPGFECRHNLGYWRQLPYLGLGASAASCLPDERSSGTVYVRTANPPGLEAYQSMVAQRNWPLRESTPISPSEARFETLMLGLRTTAGISEADFQHMHGVSLASCYGAKLTALKAQGLLVHEGDDWRLTRRGMDVQNAILVELMENETPFSRESHK